jgi:hypothetical protein
MATITPIQCDIHVADVGTVFRCTITDSGSPVPLNSGISGSNVILFRKPDGTVLSVPAVFESDGSDGIIKYTVTGSSVLDQSGTWQLTANVNTYTGKWTATAVAFTVLTQFLT